jgi:hypothetical protein
MIATFYAEAIMTANKQEWKKKKIWKNGFFLDPLHFLILYLGPMLMFNSTLLNDFF